MYEDFLAQISKTEGGLDNFSLAYKQFGAQVNRISYNTVCPKSHKECFHSDEQILKKDCGPAP